jgi:hypothetical protein
MQAATAMQGHKLERATVAATLLYMCAHALMVNEMSPAALGVIRHNAARLMTMLPVRPSAAAVSKQGCTDSTSSKGSGVGGKVPGTGSKVPGVGGKVPGTGSKVPGVGGKVPGTGSKVPGTDGGTSSKGPGVGSKVPGTSKMPGVGGTSSKGPGVGGKVPGTDGTFTRATANMHDAALMLLQLKSCSK